MATRKIDQALAAANLLNMGFAVDDVYSIADRWSKRQAERSLKNLSSYARSVNVVDNIAAGSPSRLFVSFHYSSYAHLYRSIAFRSKDRAISSLIGEQGDSHQEALTTLAREFDFDIQFVHSGPSMVKRMRQALREGHSGLILLDVPWSKNQTPPDTEFSTGIGAFQALSTTMRLINMIDPDYALIFAKREAQSIHLESMSDRDFAKAFATLADLILKAPEEYERLPHLHKFCKLSHSRSARVHFVEGGIRLVVDAKTMKLYKVKSAPQGPGGDSADGIGIECYGLA
jgi:hypothetical protein